MPRFTVWNTLTNVCVAEYEADQPVATYTIDPDYNGTHFETRDENGAVAVSNMHSTWTTREFLRRFDPSERIAARTLAKTDPIVEDFMDLLGRATVVSSSDPDTVAGLNYLVYCGILTAPRMNTILGA